MKKYLFINRANKSKHVDLLYPVGTYPSFNYNGWNDTVTADDTMSSLCLGALTQVDLEQTTDSVTDSIDILGNVIVINDDEVIPYIFEKDNLPLYFDGKAPHHLKFTKLSDGSFTVTNRDLATRHNFRILAADRLSTALYKGTAKNIANSQDRLSSVYVTLDKFVYKVPSVTLSTVSQSIYSTLASIMSEYDIVPYTELTTEVVGNTATYLVDRLYDAGSQTPLYKNLLSFYRLDRKTFDALSHESVVCTVTDTKTDTVTEYTGNDIVEMATTENNVDYYFAMPLTLVNGELTQVVRFNPDGLNAVDDIDWQDLELTVVSAITLPDAPIVPLAAHAGTVVLDDDKPVSMILSTGNEYGATDSADLITQLRTEGYTVTEIQDPVYPIDFKCDIASTVAHLSHEIYFLGGPDMKYPTFEVYVNGIYDGLTKSDSTLLSWTSLSGVAYNFYTSSDGVAYISNISDTENITFEFKPKDDGFNKNVVSAKDYLKVAASNTNRSVTKNSLTGTVAFCLAPKAAEISCAGATELVTLTSNSYAQNESPTVDVYINDELVGSDVTTSHFNANFFAGTLETSRDTYGYDVWGDSSGRHHFQLRAPGTTLKFRIVPKTDKEVVWDGVPQTLLAKDAITIVGEDNESAYKDPDTGVITFCLVTEDMISCDYASNSADLIFTPYIHAESNVYPTYDFYLNGNNLGTIDGMGGMENLTEDLAMYLSSGGTLSIHNPGSGSARIKLVPVSDGVIDNVPVLAKDYLQISPSNTNQSVRKDSDTGVITFCLVTEPSISCDGATYQVSINHSLAYRGESGGNILIINDETDEVLSNIQGYYLDQATYDMTKVLDPENEYIQAILETEPIHTDYENYSTVTNLISYSNKSTQDVRLRIEVTNTKSFPSETFIAEETEFYNNSTFGLIEETEDEYNKRTVYGVCLTPAP